MDTTTNEGNLCAKCGSIDVDAVLSTKPLTSNLRGRLILDLGFNEDDNMQSSSNFCKFLAAMKPAPLFAFQQSDLGLYSFRPRYRLWWHDVENVVLGVLPKSQAKARNQQAGDKSLARSGYFMSTKPTNVFSQKTIMRGRAIEPDKIDYSVLRGCLQHCQSTHKACRTRRPSKHPQSLKLIHCRSRRLQQASFPCSYLALSYVWGPIAEEGGSVEFRNGTIPYPVPKTIEDAMIVTASLGYEYLWVDKYCIDQKNTEDKKHQIGQMDLIYLNAELTIVASAGDKSSYGLPGVSTVQRTRQPRAHIGKHLLVSLLREPRLIIESSPWSSRGWTFQEAVLSRRLLIFTEQQVYFECQSTNFCEAVEIDRDWNSYNVVFSNDEQRSFPWHIIKRISDYSKRELSNRNDILNAFLGILRSYEASKHPVYHHFGVPVLPSVVKGRNGWPSRVQGHSHEGFLRGLCWQHVGPGSRRIGFPSWSWIGWNIVVSAFSEEIEYGFKTMQDNHTEILLEDAHQSLVPWNVYWSSIGENKSFSPYIHLAAQTMQLRFDYDRDSANTQPKYLPSGREPTLGSAYWATFDMKEEVLLQARLYLLRETEDDADYHTELSTHAFIGVVLGGTCDLDEEQNIFVMVVQDKGDCFERIGHLILGKGHIRLNNTTFSKPSEWHPREHVLENFSLYHERKTIRIG